MGDGFQWVPRADTNVNPNDPNVSRKLRRLYLGNLPYHLGVTEDSFSKQLFDTMKERGMCNDPNQNPVLHVWFARDKGANYGFCEVASIEATERRSEPCGYDWWRTGRYGWYGAAWTGSHAG